VALAVVGALEPPVHDGAMRRGSKQNETSAPTQPKVRAAVAVKSSAKKGGVKRRPARKRATVASALEKTVGYRFKDRELLDRSLTHVSALAGGNRASSYQRLEFLGDHVLGLIISDMLFRAFPKADEGELSRRLADLVRREACADVARAIEIGEALRLGASEVNAGGRLRTAILADACEALVGAVFLDGGYAQAQAFVERLWGERMRAPVRPLRDAKTMLQEWAQARGLPTPTYREVERTGPHHSPEFRVAVALPNREPAEGLGPSKRSAEQAAAAAMLGREGVRADRADG
jgi:ribonuclease-3